MHENDDGHRSVEAAVEVPGSPEDVWRAIATGPGISSWFVPTTSDERVGGETVNSFGPGMDAVARITEWNPPHRYAAESEEPAETEEGPGTVATEWIVEARDGGRCVVRVVHRWFAETDRWDGEFEGHAYGWSSSFFRMLRLYLTHFAGQKCSAFDLAAFSNTPPPEAWRTIKSAVRIDEEARRVEAPAGAPELSGAVESTEITDPDLLGVRESSPQIRAALEGMGGEEPELLLRLERPAPGIAHLFLMPMGEQTMVSIRFFLYGDQGAAAAADAEQAWNDWLAARFPQDAPA
ncbi:SRPBCC domain-containing protein [Egibacter rhizosphaerae]|uniref:SRPBCC domain-containing protein n=1 Tax=Egibacter rhizosphaerae TaxID=1670831 RepID=A0A411YL30_9ACTN|nr:SRPBCC domain-containing protein [Egibacter rhizosphaerae]